MSTDCTATSNNAGGMMLLTLAGVTLATTLSLATLWSGTPLDQLGKFYSSQVFRNAIRKTTTTTRLD